MPRTRGARDEAPPEGPAASPQLSFFARGATSPAAPAAPPVAPSPPRAKEEALGDGAPSAEPRVYQVVELVRASRLALEARFADVRVEGEISGLRRSGPGHLYFTLKDAEAQLDCVLFSREAVRLRFELRDGLAVRCRGRLTIYEGRGKFQMTVSAVEPAGAGALALAFEQLKQRLAAEGLFDQDKKRPLPFLPRRVGVVTSPHGAVLQDIIRVAHRRFPAAILLAPAPVQGEGASALLTRALERLARVPDVDVIIVARGGGSLEDLWAFNDEGLARAIAACRVPVISAVGHETDFTIADFVADVRAPTPSAAAELAVPVASELRDALAVLRRRQLRAASASLQARHLGLERLRGRLGDPRRMVDARRQRLDDWQARATEALRAAGARRRGELRQAETRLFRAHPQRRIAAQRSALAALEGELREAARARLASMAEALATLERRLPAAAAGLTDRRRRNLEALAATLEALSPLRVLDRGYGLVRRDDGSVLRDTDDVSVGARIAIRLARGALDAEVVAVTPAPTDAPGNAAPRDGATPEVATRKGATRRGTK